MTGIDTAVPSAPPPPTGPVNGWTGGRVASVVAGSLLALIAFALIVGGAGAMIWSSTQRDEGYLTTSTVGLSSSGYAIRSERLDISGIGSGAPRLLGKVRLRVGADDPSTQIFVGIARAVDVDRYLAGVASSTVRRMDTHRMNRTDYQDRLGGPPSRPPAQETFWVASTSGPGTQTLIWKVRSGAWSIVIMTADASAPVAVQADIGATVPALDWIAGGIIVVGVLLAAAATALIAVPVHRAGQHAMPPPVPASPIPPPVGPTTT